MEELKHSKTSSKVQNELLNMIIDKNGKIIALNPAIKKIIPEAAPQKNFFELFDEETVISLQRIFLDARKYEIIGRDFVEIKSGGKTNIYEFIFSPLRSESNIYFYIDILEKEQAEQKQNIDKFFIATSEIEKICSNKKIHSIINRIKLTFPFTFIEKAKIQKEINEIDEYFWLKDASGKFILINEKYASSLGFTSSQLENKREEDYLPKYLVPLYNNINNYIINSSNAVIIEGSTPITSQATRNINIVQFPICDLDNKVVAIIGFSQEIEDKSKSSENLIGDVLIKNLPLPALFLNIENSITAYSDILSSFFEFKSDILNKTLSKIFPKDFTEQIHNYISNSQQKEVLKFHYKFDDESKFDVDVTAQKLFDEGVFIGTIILFSKKEAEEIYPSQQVNVVNLLMQNISEPMYVYDIENLKFLEVNDSALKLYGYKRNEFLNMDLTDLFAPEDIQTLIQSSDSKSSFSLTGPWRHKRSDGTSLLININRIPIDYKNKKAHLNIIRDITKEFEEKKKIQLFQSIYENTSDLVIHTDRDGFIVDINDNVPKKIGYSKKELESRPLISLVSDEDRAKVNKTIFHSGILKPVSIEVKLKKQSGDFRKANLIATPIKNYQSEIESYIIIIKLVEEQREEQEQRQFSEVISSIDSAFLSSMFHEILTPLNVIIGFTQELWESIESPSNEQKESIEIIKDNQNILMQIMDNAIEYSTLLQKEVKIKPEQIILEDAIEEIKRSLIKEARSIKKEIIFENINFQAKLESDKQKFITLINLIIKFALSITKETKLFVSFYEKDSENLSVAIKDTQNSITPLLLKGMQDVFSEEETASRKNYGFSRFSIRLAKKLIDLLSVNIETIKKEESESEFALIFPKKFILKEDISIDLGKSIITETRTVVQTSEKIEKQREKPQKELDLSQLSCLYLEDQIDSQILFKSQMKELKSIEVAPSLEAALPLLKTKRFDFLIIDINLQGEYNGLDALRIIQKIPGYKNIPMIASTAYMQPGARDNFIAAGFTDFISKPLLKEKIVEILKRIYQ
ncbi:MAG: PAS domain S-box protein [Melioribacter sp.]|uniref:PAS domain S-box protein n=1 Tax=Rosettibacter primus TaxID=3111523 RepID=UPI00247DF19C|nr:PAS domain S-box protein [Melioribacter sp.]